MTLLAQQLNEVVVDAFKKEISNLLQVIQGMDQRIRKIEAMLIQALPKSKPRVDVTQSTSVPSSPNIQLRSNSRVLSKRNSQHAVSPLSKEQKENIKKLLSQDSVTLHFMHNYKKIAILTFEKTHTILHVKKKLQNELKQDNVMPALQNIILSRDRPLVCLFLNILIM